MSQFVIVSVVILEIHLNNVFHRLMTKHQQHVIMLLAVLTLNVDREIMFSNVHVRRVSMVILSLDVGRNVSSIQTVILAKLASITNVLIHVKELVDKMLNVKSSITLQCVFAHLEPKEIHSLAVNNVEMLDLLCL
jgi:hypothetical protein